MIRRILAQSVSWLVKSQKLCIFLEFLYLLLTDVRSWSCYSGLEYRAIHNIVQHNPRLRHVVTKLLQVCDRSKAMYDQHICFISSLGIVGPSCSYNSRDREFKSPKVIFNFFFNLDIYHIYNIYHRLGLTLDSKSCIGFVSVKLLRICDRQNLYWFC